MKKNNTLALVVLGIVIIASAALWFTGSYKSIFFGDMENQKLSGALAVDLEGLQVTIRTVSTPTIEELVFIQAIDTMAAHESLKKMRNPFVRVYVAPPPSAKPKSSSRKKTTKKAAPRKKRVVRPKITINGIIWDRSSPYAILNSDIYGEGDVIQGYTVQTIQDTMIVLANKDDVYSIIYYND